ncbi:hypothetical protein [Kineococcus aurantiacus]|uniref:hypothetical protein n=1 Tax=Kineococcus aurantiacus TaxID=37633 RepID=UPI0031CE70D1
MSVDALVQDLPDEPELRAQTHLGLPPQFVTIGGVRRTRGRSLTPAEAVAQAQRGRPAYLFTFGKCALLPPAVLEEVLNEPDFQGSTSVHEADVHMYGRHRRGEPDTRLIGVSFASRVE